MSDHEQRMREARAHVASVRNAQDLATVPLERRGKYDIWAHLERLQKSCDEERQALNIERQKNAAMRKAILKHARSVRIVYWFGAVLATAMFGLGFYLIQRNREAIEVSCLVVVQVVRDSGANSGKPRETPVGKAQARVTAAFYRELLGEMTPERRAKVLRDLAFIRRSGGAIPEPNCEQVARDPDRVRRETLQK